MIILINNKKYDVLEAKTEEERKQGLKGVKELPKDEGMLFYMDNKQPLLIFTMVGMEIPLDIIFINLDDEVIDVKSNCKPGTLLIVGSVLDTDDYIAYVLEVNPDSGIKVGDELDFEDEPVMKVLFLDGSELMSLYGGERIFSRKNTKILIKKAKKAALSLSDTDYKALGKYMFKCIKTLDNRDPEYVELKSNKSK